MSLLFACGGGGGGTEHSGSSSPVTLQAQLTLSTARAAPGDTVTADARLSTGNKPLSYSFDWGDGQVSNDVGSVATHAYSATGIFPITLRVVDRTGAASAAANLAVWTSTAPDVQIAATDAVMPGEPLTIDASATSTVNGAIASYTFALSTGETRTQASPVAVFTFAEPGFYSVQVTATDEAGESATLGRGLVVGLKMTLKTKTATEPASFYRSAPRMARDASGTLYAIWFDGGGLAFSRSTDNGHTFEPQTTIVDRDGPFEADILGSALAVSGNGTVHIGVSWNAADFGYVRSTDGGATFEPLQFFDPVDGLFSFSPSIAVSGDDVVAVSWVQQPFGALQPQASPVAVSSNGGQGYSVVSALPALDFNCSAPVAYDGSTLVATWHEVLQVPDGNLTRIVRVATSADGGATFSDPITLDTELNTFCPAVRAQNGHIAVFWIAGSIVENQRLMVSVSSDSGATWSPPVSATQTFTNAKCGNVTFDSAGNLYVAYSEGEIGNFEHALRASSDGGRTFGPALFPSLVFDNADCVQIDATAPGVLDMMWSEPRLDGTPLYEVYYGSAEMSVP